MSDDRGKERTSSAAQRPGTTTADRRKDRLAAALRSNLRKRKSQEKARAAGTDGEVAPDGEPDRDPA